MTPLLTSKDLPKKPKKSYPPVKWMEPEEPRDQKSKQTLYWSDPFARAVNGIKQVLESGDDRACEVLLSNIAVFRLNTELLKKYHALEKHVANLEKHVAENSYTIEELRDVFEEHKPPNGEEERRKAWIEMKRAIGLE